MPERICAIGRDGDAWARVLDGNGHLDACWSTLACICALQRRALKGVNGALLSRAGMLSAGAASLRSGLTPIAVFRSGLAASPHGSWRSLFEERGDVVGVRNAPFVSAAVRLDFVLDPRCAHSAAQDGRLSHGDVIQAGGAGWPMRRSGAQRGWWRLSRPLLPSRPGQGRCICTRTPCLIWSQGARRGGQTRFGIRCRMADRVRNVRYHRPQRDGARLRHRWQWS